MTLTEWLVNGQWTLALLENFVQKEMIVQGV